jgi:hypothetical protein
MEIRDYAYKKNFNTLNPDQQSFAAKFIVKDVERIAKKLNISEETAYEFYIKGAFDGGII